MQRLHPLTVASMAAACLIWTACSPGCVTAHRRPDAAPTTPAAINHVVFFKLRDPGLADNLIADSRRLLGEIPGVVSLFAGRHIDAGRASVETDYDACVYVGFETLDDYAVYVDHPNHLQLVSDWKQHFEWYRVYDVLDKSYTIPSDQR